MNRSLLIQAATVAMQMAPDRRVVIINDPTPSECHDFYDDHINERNPTLNLHRFIQQKNAAPRRCKR